MKLGDIKFTYLKSVNSTCTEVITLQDYIDRGIKEKGRIMAYRETSIKQIKTGMPVVVPAAIMSRGHSYKCFKKLTGWASFDIDELEVTTEEAKEILKDDPYIFFLMKSVSGKGLWGLVRFGNTTYPNRYDALIRYFDNKYGMKLDMTGANVNRLRFLSYDEDYYWNGDAQRFDKTTAVPRLVRMAKNGVTLDMKVKHKYYIKPSDKIKINRFNKEHTCGEILTRNEWTYVRTDYKDREHYLRPGSSSHDSSGNVANGLFYCWTEASKLKNNKLYTPFDLYVALEHKWNNRVALNSIRRSRSRFANL